MRRTTILKYHAIKNRFDVLHNDQRLRLDDVVRQLCAEFYMTELTIWRILNRDAPEIPPPEVNPAQLDMFPPPPGVQTAEL